MRDILILVSCGFVLAVLARPQVRNAPLWRATVTPLASIIGSGFLVLGPILESSYGRLAPVVMAGLCAVAWMFGGAIRLNIRARAENPNRPKLETMLEVAASWALAFAYVISVAYYLNLFGAFGVSLTPFDDQLSARLLTSAVLTGILAVGWSKGFGAMERMEQFSVSLKLAIIAGLLIGLISYFYESTLSGSLVATVPRIGIWAGVTLAMGLIVTVQGFETSRYLGADYSPAVRVRSMMLAQIIATIIYLAYIGPLTFSLPTEPGALTETAIIDIMARVATILPPLLVAAALAAQFSAAVADTAGAGGLIAELTKGGVETRWAYAILVVLGLGLTWTADVFLIISYASRAFAAYYTIQSAIAAAAAWRGAAGANKAQAILYAGLALTGIATVLLGRPVE
jgi:hypothetical protein